jgi:hypothetical protein
VATLSIKRIPEPEIIKEIFHQTNKTITTRYLSDLKPQTKRSELKDSTDYRPGCNTYPS